MALRQRHAGHLVTTVLACLVGLAAANAPALALDGFDPAGEGAGYPVEANGRATSPPRIRARYLDGFAIKLDGRLDDDAWHDAPAGGGFVQADPDRGSQATEQTVFKVAYDHEAIYFGVACYEQDPAKTSKALSRRDHITDSDLVSVYVDPYLDKTTGYNFRVNPLGVKLDQYVFNDGDFDLDWDAVWEAQTSADAGGWYVEMRIPFSSIRYRAADSMTWGLQVYRWMHGRGEDTAWVIWDREKKGFVSRFGELSGIEGVPPPRQLELLPYIVQRTTDPATAGRGDQYDNFENLGLDMKYGVTADLTLNATLQPDFGQVEADPAVLNLSPFETQFEEKRPFFIEGSRFFEHPDFSLFYTRRIGTGDESSRIRAAGKLTGKLRGGWSVAALAASTDVTGQGQAHNFTKEGRLPTRYFIGRFGKEFAGGAHRINFMQTAVVRRNADREAVGDRLSRDGYTSGVDFDLNFRDRSYNIQGSVVGSVIDPAKLNSQPEVGHHKIWGNGGALDLRKRAGTIQYGVSGRWEGDRLDINDAGIIRAPDEKSASGFFRHLYNGDGKQTFFQRGETNVNWYHSLFYAARSAQDPADPSRQLWSYGHNHRQYSGGNVNGWWQRRNYWSHWYGVWLDAEGSDKFVTRGGPLMTTPMRYGFWVGSESDWRKKVGFSTEWSFNWNRTGLRETSYNTSVRWTQSNALNHNLKLTFSDSRYDAQWVDNFDDSGAGIGGVSYVFGQLDQRTVDLTLRTNVLFSRDRSLEIYVQPFLTVGSYSNPRELARADSYELRPYAAADFDLANFDFSYASVNANLVYRWEYRPGSTFFLVWTHARNSFEERGAFAGTATAFDNPLRPGQLFRNEPENTLLAKLTWWLSI